MDKIQTTQEVIKAAGVFLNPNDGTTRYKDQDTPGPFTGIVYYLPKFTISVHTGFAIPSQN